MIDLSRINLSRINLGQVQLPRIILGRSEAKPEIFDPASFDEAWTVTGKTNDDEDRATVKNLTGNGNDLVLSNFAFARDSGYGLYSTSFVNSFWIKDPNLRNTNSFHFTIPLGIHSSFVLHTDIRGKTSNIPPFKINVSGLENFQFYYYYVSSDNTRYGFRLKDGINNLPESHIANLDMDGWVGFGDVYGIKNQVTIEQIPNYEGYLVTDGVDDKIASSAFEMGKDFTVVGEWVLLTTNAVNAGIIKPNSWLLYNRITGIALFINSATLSTTISNVKSIKAICSDGRIYLDDWSEMLISKDQDITSSTSVLSIGFNGTVYTQMAFKNLSIYDGKILSKEECIKAYNYLQTLKAK